MNNKKEVIKASAAVQVQNNMTLLQRRAWNILLANAYDELPTEERHHIGVHDLMRVLDFHSKNEDYLKVALEALVGCKVKWNVLDKDGTAVWGVAALLAEAVIKEGVCAYAYGPTFRKLLYNPKMYARVCLSLQNKFDSKHALALWELCIDYLGGERDYGETPFISLEQFRELMGITEGMYPTFKRLSEKVVNPAIAEINRLSDFRVTVDYQRQSRKDEGVRPAVPSEQANEAFEHYIREKIHLLKRNLASGKVESITGFLLDAIRKNFANPEYAQERKRHEVVEALKVNKKRKTQIERLEGQKAEIEKARDEALRETYEELARMFPEVLEAALGSIFVGNKFLNQSYEHDKSPLENYQERLIFKDAFRPYLERHAPERIQAVQTQYATEIAALEEQIAALQLM